MPYNPTTTNKSGQIYAELGLIPAAKAKAAGILGAAQIGAQQSQQQQSMLWEGMQKAGGAFQEAMQGVAKNNMQRDFMRTGMESLMDRGIVSPGTMEKFSKAPLGGQQAIWAENSAIWDSYLKSQQGEDTLNRQIRLKEAESEIDRRGLGQPVWSYDKQTKQWNQVAMQTGPSSVTPTKEKGNLPAEPAPLKVIGPDGKPAFRRAKWDPVGQYWIHGAGDYIRDEQGNIQKAEQGGYNLNFGMPAPEPAPGQ